ENTHMPSCGRPWRVDEVENIGGVGARHGISLYCDGARIWNASVALGVPARELVAPATAVVFCWLEGVRGAGGVGGRRAPEGGAGRGGGPAGGWGARGAGGG